MVNTKIETENYKGHSINFIEKIIGGKKQVTAKVSSKDMNLSVEGTTKQDTLTKIKKMINVDKKINASDLIKRKLNK
jgi:hypothetical protein